MMIKIKSMLNDVLKYQLILVLLALSAGGMEVTRLRVEYLDSPLGIDESLPRFSWELHSEERGALQSAYQIQVSSEKSDLIAGRPDLWDSGKVRSSETAQIIYAGKPLKPGQHAYWQVKVWDGSDAANLSNTSEWSKALEEKDWNAEWIGLKGVEPIVGEFPKDPRWLEPADPSASKATFRTSFDLKTPPEHLRLMVATQGDFSLWVNGRNVMGGKAETGPQALDVSGYLVAGANSVAVQVMASAAKSPKLCAAMMLPDGQNLSEMKWKVSSATMPFWEKASFDDSKWLDAKRVAVSEQGLATWTAQDRVLPARLLRREFAVSQPIRRATLHLAGLGLHEAWINGQKVSNEVLAPGFSDYRHRVPSVARDVTHLMKHGENAIGIQLGNGRYYAPRIQIPAPTISYGWPVAKGCLVIENSDGSSSTVTTDSTWKATTKGPIRANNEYDGETYDARMEMAGWSEADFIHGDWQNAEILPAPTGVVSAIPCEPIRVVSSIKMKAIKQVKPGTWVCDFGQNLTGWCRLFVKGKSGETVKLRHAQRLLPDGNIDPENLRSALATDRYILKGATEGESWEPRFTYHGFRYVELSGYPGEPNLTSLEAKVIGTDVREAGTFHCSDPVLNQIIQNARWSLRSNYMSVPLDCSDRDERQGWQGDRGAESRGETTLFDVAAIYTKWLGDIRHSQREDGSVSDVAPASWQFYSSSALWPSVQTMMTETLFLKYADRRILEKHYPGNAKWVGHLMTRLDADGMLPPDPYGDWCVPPENRALIQTSNQEMVTDKAFLAAAYLAKHLSLMAWSARTLGKTEEAKQWDMKFDALRESIRKRFWKNGTLANGTQTSFALGFHFNLVPEAARADFAKAMITRIKEHDQGHIRTGNIGVQWLHTALDDIGQSDTALLLATRKDYPGLGYMIDQGATTIWELWNGDTAEMTMNSTNHIMLIGDLLTWCFERLAGIQASEVAPGYRQILLRPSVPDGLREVSATQQTLRGPVKSAWKNDNEKFVWEVEIPANTQAILTFPPPKKVKDYQIKESGKVVEPQEGKMIDGRWVMKISSGRYQFEAN
jgi:alpha-L-rhamnosidase